GRGAPAANSTPRAGAAVAGGGGGPARAALVPAGDRGQAAGRRPGPAGDVGEPRNDLPGAVSAVPRRVARGAVPPGRVAFGPDPTPAAAATRRRGALGPALARGIP